MLQGSARLIMAMGGCVVVVVEEGKEIAGDEKAFEVAFGRYVPVLVLVGSYR